MKNKKAAGQKSSAADYLISIKVLQTFIVPHGYYCKKITVYTNYLVRVNSYFENYTQNLVNQWELPMKIGLTRKYERGEEKMGKTNFEYIAVKILSNKCRYGNSRHKAKIEGISNEFIYSFNTYKTYVKQAKAFFNWIENNHPEVKKFNKSKKYINEYLEKFNSPWTQATISSALVKVFGSSKEELGIITKPRHRSDIKRSRNVAKRDSHFSEVKNEELVNFCKKTGLRRSELENLKGNCIKEMDGQYYIENVKGKGGKVRDVPILGNDVNVIEKIKNTPKEQKVWERVSSAADIHSYRSDYCIALYNSFLKKSINEVPRWDRYYCRNDKAGIVYQRSIMEKCSLALGHNRIEIIARNYLR